MDVMLVIADQYNVVQLTKEICMDTYNDLPVPGPEEYAKCSALVAKVMIQNDHVYSAEEIETARELRRFQWRTNVEDFLAVIAGIEVPRDEAIDEAWMALVYVPKNQ